MTQPEGIEGSSALTPGVAAVLVAFRGVRLQNNYVLICLGHGLARAPHRSEMGDFAAKSCVAG